MTVAGVLEKGDKIPKSMKTGAIYIMVGNTILDPLIYGLCMKDIRKRCFFQRTPIYVKAGFNLSNLSEMHKISPEMCKICQHILFREKNLKISKNQISRS